jgi:hypothetical protein
MVGQRILWLGFGKSTSSEVSSVQRCAGLEPTSGASPCPLRLIERSEFEHICDEVGGVSDSDALLDFLHHTGVVFHRPGVFGDRILDQNWALEAVYSIFHRKKILPGIRSRNGKNRTLRPSKDHSSLKNAPECDYSSFYGATGTGTPAALLRRI